MNDERSLMTVLDVSNIQNVHLGISPISPVSNGFLRESEGNSWNSRINQCSAMFLFLKHWLSPYTSQVVQNVHTHDSGVLMPAQQPQFSPKQVAIALGASESSVKRWCDQGAIPTIRTVGGHRKITLEGLQHFLRSSNRGLEAPQALGLPPLQQRREDMVPGGSDPDQELFRHALAEGDEDECRRVLWKRVRGGEFRSEVAGYLITDAMHGFGQAWDCDQLDAYQERRGCDICIRLINELRGDLPPIAERAPVAIGGTPQGDPYQLPTALVELSLREAGWNAVSLGNNLPTDSFLQAIQDYRPQLVWLSVSAISNLQTFIAEQLRLADHINDDVSLLVGGRALNAELRTQLRYTAHCDGLQNLVDLALMIRPVRRF